LKIEFYKTFLCPRCHLTSLQLKKLQPIFPDLEIEHIEIITNISRAWGNGIRSVPAIKAENDILSGILLSGEQIRSFIECHCHHLESEK